jgi:hypothetical protein
MTKIIGLMMFKELSEISSSHGGEYDVQSCISQKTTLNKELSLYTGVNKNCNVTDW